MTGGEDGLAEVGLEVGRPVLPMLASSAPDVAAAMAKAGGGQGRGRREARRHPDPGPPRGDEVQVATRSLDDITDAAARGGRGRPVTAGDTSSCSTARRWRSDDDGRPRPFQETASRTAQADRAGGVAVTPYFFDVLHVDGHDLLDAPGSERLAALDALVPEEHRVPRLVTATRRRRRAVRTAALVAGPRRGRREEPLDRVRRRPSRRRMGQGEAGAHPRPGRAGRRVGQRPPRGLAVQHPPRCAQPRRRASRCWARRSRG